MEILDEKTRAALDRLAAQDPLRASPGHAADVAMVRATVERAEARERAVQHEIGRLLTLLAEWGPDRPAPAAVLADVATALAALASPTGPFNTPAAPLEPRPRPQ